MVSIHCQYTVQCVTSERHSNIYIAVRDALFSFAANAIH